MNTAASSTVTGRLNPVRTDVVKDVEKLFGARGKVIFGVRQ